jgi:hypothetical protein
VLFANSFRAAGFAGHHLDLSPEDVGDGGDGLQLRIHISRKEPADARRLFPDCPSQLSL